MKYVINYSLNDKQISFLELTFILTASVIPIFFNYSYDLNIYLSWEGAYRLYLGQIPYKDFTLPMGFGYWIIPAIFFKIFGPYLITLIKAQAFINIISALAFRQILKQLGVHSGVRLLSVFLYILTYTTLNIWPWYNNSVIAFEFIGLAFLIKFIMTPKNNYSLINLSLGSFFLFLSFFTKQDAGFFAFLIGLSLIIYDAVSTKRILGILWFIIFYLFFGLLAFLPFIQYDIGYWFNYGQAPHSSRISLYDILNSLFGSSEWIKLSILAITLIAMVKLKRPKDEITNNYIIFSVLIIGILIEASVFQVTSYVPGYNNIFFYSFVIGYIFSSSGLTEKINFRKIQPLFLTGLCILIWWSGRIWPYINQEVEKFFPKVEAVDTTEVSIRSYMRSTPKKSNWATSLVPDQSKWKYAPWKVFKRISMPTETIEGIKRLLNNPVVKNKKDIRVLNMTELTPLAEIIGYTPETGPGIPLWYHKNVAIFQKQIDQYKNKINHDYYDIILFEYIPILNNFFPFEIRDSLKINYQQVDTFPAPRSVYYRIIEVYIRKQKTKQRKNDLIHP